MCILAGTTPCCLSYINIKMSSLLTGKTARLICSSLSSSLSFFFLFSILWLTASANTKGTFFSCYITKTWTVYLKGCGGHMDCWVAGWLLQLSINLSCKTYFWPNHFFFFNFTHHLVLINPPYKKKISYLNKANRWSKITHFPAILIIWNHRCEKP